ncbi:MULTISPECIES: transglycosylase domain-containing protein [Alistipes]|uniref:Transglycosylase domain-containing protein n=1 Tax=Alistipes intestinihominis TaxID=3133172 RepID=A0ABV1GUK3_9BACT|nr:transglycosylase domain-containing protein [Alistipes senegalensis]MBD9301908.1 penicillin-binding protein [Alistipes senegalensis]MCI7309195.1 penicillin-binding protein [Alistipes senegalensis]MDD7037718.1 transglycosylase domain-containing protein [Alistipes senegalensis]MDY2877444.1 transglycosylase domain-containing protein [Alistipes senegalensis]MDY4571484.1 transglycosylase domain-containing protein [Alistipes senegalensis]
MTQRKKTGVSPKMIKWIWCVALAPFAFVGVLLLLTALGVFGRMPSFEELENPRSNLATEIYSEDGKVIGTFFVQNRSYVQYADLFPSDSTLRIRLDGYEVPPIVAALISTEDIRFRGHSGIDIPSLARVAVKTLLMQNTSQGGGSTITQQLAKNLFPRDTARNRGAVVRKAKLVTAKLKEWITALKLEYNYTKEEIAAMYLNTVEFGSNAYGIKSAAHTFFNKEPDELNVQEAAVLVGVVNAPTRYSPVRNPDNALARRNLVLSRMEEAGALTRRQRDSIAALPIVLNYRPVSHNEGSATYFREMLRLVMNAERPKRSQFYNEWDYDQAVKEYDENPLYGWCLKNRKADGTPYNIYRDGLKIYTTINSVMQSYAEQAVQRQMEKEIQPKMDAQYRSTKTLFIGADREERERIMRHAVRYSDRYREMKNAGASEKQIQAAFDKPCDMKVFTYKGERDTLMTPRDSILHHKRIMRAAMVALDPRTGFVKAYVGGPNFRYFKYDMAKQGKRQIGSTIKPFVYTFAIDHLGMTPCTMVPNLPTTIETANGTAWSPKEAGNVEYDGVLHPLSWGLARSRNNYSAWIMKQAKQPAAVADFIHNMGIRSYIDPVPALALGSSESNVFELVSAFSTFANQGVHTDAIFVTRIEDRQGNLIASFIPQSQDAISERTAYTMLTMLQGVVNAGTAGRLKWQFGFNDVEIGGKTGTSNQNRDAWFMCVAPKLVAGAWVGGEDQSVHFVRGGEGSVMALPIVGDFMKRVYDDGRFGIGRGDQFLRPAMMPRYDCDEEVDPGKPDTSDEDDFFN